jgi:hypothetical protein
MNVNDIGFSPDVVMEPNSLNLFGWIPEVSRAAFTAGKSSKAATKAASLEPERTTRPR